ncbi:ABC transporter ATP-binding protein/permease [Agrobacterium sp. O3.4]|uniref:ABC transporter ATP-binding protein/permease n=1 Tax=Agrobacterium cucumeris TaxID=2862866 RepID=A0ABY8RKH9_9HYPH|nr:MULTISPECIES: ABC transporter ATP-binding protein [Rhizobium/Agrobacterium group]MCZ7472106.1 ABC transporter ATP-binding protein [Rhizobium rhizogenes]WHO07649.1 ABC transporter ATP-binding protein/permease [Agrobacterium cucumeris]
MADRDPLLYLGTRLDAASLGRMLDGLLLVAQPLLAAVFLWQGAGGNSGRSALWCAGILLLIFIARRLLLWPALRKLYAEAYGGGLRLRRAILAHLIRMPLGAFRAIEGGKLIQAVSEDVLWLENHASYTRPEIAANAAALCACLIGALLFWPIAGLAVVATMIIGFVVLVFAQRRLATGLERRGRSLAAVSLAMQEQAEGVSVLRAFSGEDDIGEDFARNVAQLRHGAWRGIRQMTPIAILFRMAIELSAAIAMLIAVLTLGEMSGADTIHKVVALLLIVSAIVPARNFASLTAMLVLARIGRRNVDAIFAVPAPISHADSRPDTFDIRYENVSFTHGGRKVPTLSGISFSAKQGEMVALIGANGSGKTTCLQLLMRFFEPDDGTICIGGRDIRQINDQVLASMIAPVFQETLLFNETIADNIRVGRPSASDAEVEAAARAAVVHDTIMEFENGYDTMVGTLGARLSGGERQRICIARAILKDAPIILLDEATSAVDPENEEAIQQAISALAIGRTLFVIAHKLPSIIAADRIILLDAGAMVASDTHEVLLQTSQDYRRLWNRSTVMESWTMAIHQ